jgi:uncharacterized protein
MKDTVSAMEIDLGRVEDRSTFSFDGTLDVPIPGGGEGSCAVVVTTGVTRSLSRYNVETRVKGEIRAECHRCLGTFAMPVEIVFDVVLSRGEGVLPPEGIEEDDFVAIPATGEARYDILPRVREALVLEIPIKLLCREDCKGACAKCGANLNEGECGCGSVPGDPRWGALKNFLNGENKT